MNRNLSPQVAKGMFGGPRGLKGNYLEGNANQVSGVTYGGQGLGLNWWNYPSYLIGVSDYYGPASMPGSNVQAVAATTTGAADLSQNAGLSL